MLLLVSGNWHTISRMERELNRFASNNGVTMQLLEERLPDRGVTVQRKGVRVADIATLDGAFLTSARGIASVGAVDDVELTIDPDRMRRLEEAYAAVPWDPIEVGRTRSSTR